MKVGDLKELIKDLPDDLQVVLQKDAEGNGYSPCAGTDPNCVYVPESSWSGEIYNLKWDHEDCCLDRDTWNSYKNDMKMRALVLYPVN